MRSSVRRSHGAGGASHPSASSSRPRAEPDVINARHLHDVIDVIDDGVDIPARHRVFAAALFLHLLALLRVRILLLQLAHFVEEVQRHLGRFGLAETRKEIHHDDAIIRAVAAQRVAASIPNRTLER